MHSALRHFTTSSVCRILESSISRQDICAESWGEDLRRSIRINWASWRKLRWEITMTLPGMTHGGNSLIALWGAALCSCQLSGWSTSGFRVNKEEVSHSQLPAVLRLWWWRGYLHGIKRFERIFSFISFIHLVSSWKGLWETCWWLLLVKTADKYLVLLHRR